MGQIIIATIHHSYGPILTPKNSPLNIRVLKRQQGVGNEGCIDHALSGRTHVKNKNFDLMQKSGRKCNSMGLDVNF